MIKNKIKWCLRKLPARLYACRQCGYTILCGSLYVPKKNVCFLCKKQGTYQFKAWLVWLRFRKPQILANPVLFQQWMKNNG